MVLKPRRRPVRLTGIYILKVWAFNATVFLFLWFSSFGECVRVINVEAHATHCRMASIIMLTIHKKNVVSKKITPAQDNDQFHPPSPQPNLTNPTQSTSTYVRIVYLLPGTRYLLLHHWEYFLFRT